LVPVPESHHCKPLCDISSLLYLEYWLPEKRGWPASKKSTQQTQQPSRKEGRRISDNEIDPSSQ
jgi:hypothetical protein